MNWDPAKGKGRPRADELNPFQDLGSTYRAQKAARKTSFAAGVLSFLNFLSAASIYFRKSRLDTLVGSDPTQKTIVNVLVGLILAIISLWTLRINSVWTATLILVWSIVEIPGWLTFSLYGHVPPRFLPILVLLAAILGFRGALALKKSEATHSAFD